MTHIQIALFLLLLTVLALIFSSYKLLNVVSEYQKEKFDLLDDLESQNRFYTSKFNLKDFIDVIAVADSQTIETSESKK